MKSRSAADPPASTLETHLGYWLRLVSNEVSGAFARALQERQISVAEWVAMNQLAIRTGLTSAMLAATMGMTRGAVSKVLEKLETKKLVSRTTSPLDSRIQLLSLTAQARRILPSLTELADSNDRHFFAALDLDEQASLRQLLRRLTGAADVPPFDQKALIVALRTDQAGESSFPEFLSASWRAGVVRYDVDFGQRTVTYHGCDGETYTEHYPEVEIS